MKTYIDEIKICNACQEIVADGDVCGRCGCPPVPAPTAGIMSTTPKFTDSRLDETSKMLLFLAASINEDARDIYPADSLSKEVPWLCHGVPRAERKLLAHRLSKAITAFIEWRNG